MQRLWVGLIGVLACGGGQAETEVVTTVYDDECVDCVTDETAVAQPEPAQPVPATGRPPIQMLAAGHQHTCALTEDGAVHCWGLDNRGQLGVDVDQAAIPLAVPGLPAMDAIWAGYEMTCARAREGGRVRCWGETGLGEADIPLDGVTNVTLVRHAVVCRTKRASFTAGGTTVVRTDRSGRS